MQKPKSSKLPEGNVYLNHLEQDEWNDIRAYHIENESAWRFVEILAIVMLMLVAVYAMYSVNQDRHKIVVFEKDSLGNITTLGLATKSFAVDNKVIAQQLANFIYALREVPQDTNYKRRNIELVHNMTDPKIRAQIDNLLITQYTAAQNKAIIVDINSVKPLEGGTSWSINWREGETLDNGSIKYHYWSSVITFKRMDNVNPAVQMINPTGLFITYLHPVEDVSDTNLQ